MRVAIDSSVLVALLDQRDLWHVKAQTLYNALLEAEITPVYFDCVTAEAVSATVRRLHEQGRAAQVPVLLGRLNTQAPHETLTWIFPDVPRLYPQVLELIRSSSGELNFNDALIALACREREIPAIASFDAGFDQVAWLERLAQAADVSVVHSNS